MARTSKRERMIEATCDAHVARTENDLQNAMNDMLWILAEGTRYEDDVKKAFDDLEKLRGLRYRQ